MLFGAGGVTRTHDLLITNQLLYRLSYTSASYQTQKEYYHTFSRASSLFDTFPRTENLCLTLPLSYATLPLVRSEGELF